MNWTFALAVALGGALGAPLRAFVDSRITARTMSANAEGGAGAFPWGLLTVNAVGSLTIGIAYAAADGAWRALLVTGACGALTTYSGYALFLHRAWTRNRSVAWQAAVAMPVVCITVCAVGVLATRAVLGT